MLKNFLLPLAVSLLAGVIVWILQSFITLSWIFSLLMFILIIVGVVFIYLLCIHIKIRQLGIVRILSRSDKGEGSTKSYMGRANSQIYFVGIAASKWLDQRDTFEATIRRICALNGGRIRFLLLNPDADAVQKLSLANPETGNELAVKRKIIGSLKAIDELMEKLKRESGNLDLSSSFEVRLYDQMPVFRLTLIDNSLAYFCFYRLRSDGKKLKQLIIKPSRQEGGLFRDTDNNIFNSMADYFENIWNSPSTIRYEEWKNAQQEKV